MKVIFWTQNPDRWSGRGASLVRDDRGTCPAGPTGGCEMEIEAVLTASYNDEGDDSLGTVVEFTLPDRREYVSCSGSAGILPACWKKKGDEGA